MPWLRGPSSPEDQFACEVIALVRGILGLKAARVDGFALLIGRPDSPPVTMNLQNIYLEAQQLDGDARADRLRGPCSLRCPGPARRHGATRRRC